MAGDEMFHLVKLTASFMVYLLFMAMFLTVLGMILKAIFIVIRFGWDIL